MTNWNAIRLTSKAFKPARRVWVEIGPKEGRYFRYEELGRSVIKQSLDSLDIDYYMPLYGEVHISKRSKKPEAKFRQMIPGYALIRGDFDYDEIESLDGVSEILRYGPGLSLLSITNDDVEKVRDFEDELHNRFLKKYRSARLDRAKDYLKQRLARKKYSRKSLSQMYPVGCLFKIREGHLLQGGEGIIESHTGRNSVISVTRMFGTDIRTEFELHQIEVLEAS